MQWARYLASAQPFYTVHILPNPARQVSPELRIPTLSTRVRQHRMRALPSSQEQVEAGLPSKSSGSRLALFTCYTGKHRDQTQDAPANLNFR